MSEQEKKAMWEELHDCYSITKLASVAMLYDTGHNSSSFSTSLELVSKKLMTVISKLDDHIDYAPEIDFIPEID